VLAAINMSVAASGDGSRAGQQTRQCTSMREVRSLPSRQWECRSRGGLEASRCAQNGHRWLSSSGLAVVMEARRSRVFLRRPSGYDGEQAAIDKRLLRFWRGARVVVERTGRGLGFCCCPVSFGGSVRQLSHGSSWELPVGTGNGSRRQRTSQCQLRRRQTQLRSQCCSEARRRGERGGRKSGAEMQSMKLED